MHFQMPKNAKNFFSNIINADGSHAASDKNKFMQFDVYYCCALIGMAAIQLDNDPQDWHEIVEKYPKPYSEYKAYIAGLLVATEAKRLGIDSRSSKLEDIILRYIVSDDSLLSEDGFKTLNAYALKGYNLLRDYPLVDKPTSREEFLEAFNVAIEKYRKN